MSTRIRAIAAAAATVALAALAAPAAQAAPAPATVCPAQPMTQIFAPWKDRSLYAPVPGGAFDAGAAAWTLTGGAAIVEDGDSLLGAGGGSLELVPGSSATSPTFCVTKGFPYGRAFARSLSGRARVTVQVLHLATDGSVLRMGAASDVDASPSGWAPTQRFSLSNGLADQLGGRVQLRFTVRKGHGARVDDVFADPRLAK